MSCHVTFPLADFTYSFPLFRTKLFVFIKPGLNTLSKHLYIATWIFEMVNSLLLSFFTYIKD